MTTNNNNKPQTTAKHLNGSDDNKLCNNKIIILTAIKANTCTSTIYHYCLFVYVDMNEWLPLGLCNSADNRTDDNQNWCVGSGLNIVARAFATHKRTQASHALIARLKCCYHLWFRNLVCNMRAYIWTAVYIQR